MKTTIEETAAFSVQISGAVIPPLPQPKERIHRVKRHVGLSIVALEPSYDTYDPAPLELTLKLKR